MTEQPPRLESQEVSKDKIIEVYKKFVERGVASPDDLDPDNPEVKAANELFEIWQTQEEVRIAGDKGAQQRFNFEKTKLYVDIGFTDPSYLNNVLSWLVLDAGDVEKDTNNPQSTQLRTDIAAEMKKIRNLLQTKK